MISLRKVFFLNYLPITSTFIISITLLGLSPIVEARAIQTAPRQELEKTLPQGFLATQLNQRNTKFEYLNTGEEIELSHHARAIGLEELHTANVKAHREYLAHLKDKGKKEVNDYISAFLSYEKRVNAFHYQLMAQQRADAATGLEKAGIVFKGVLDLSFIKENAYTKLLNAHLRDLERTRAELESTYAATLPPTEAVKIGSSQPKLGK